MNAYTIFDEFLDGVFIFNEEKEIVYCNEIGATIFGTRPKRVLGKKTFEIFKIKNDLILALIINIKTFNFVLENFLSFCLFVFNRIDLLNQSFFLTFKSISLQYQLLNIRLLIRIFFQ